MMEAKLADFFLINYYMILILQGALQKAPRMHKDLAKLKLKKIDFQDDSYQQLTAQTVFFGMSQLLGAVDLMINGLFCTLSI